LSYYKVGDNSRDASVYLGPASAISVAEGATLEMTLTHPGAAFAIKAVQGGEGWDDLAGLSAMKLVFDGQDDNSTKKLEAAGVAYADEQLPAAEDFDDPTNFVIGELVVGKASESTGTYGPVTLKLVNLENNRTSSGSAGPEALYVDTLTITYGGTFYTTTNSQGHALLPYDLFYLNGGDPKRLYKGDANLDGMVNVQDMSILSTNWGKDSAVWAEADFNGDRLVNLQDLGILTSNWGLGVPSEKAGTALPELKDLDADGILDIDDVRAILKDLAKQEGD